MFSFSADALVHIHVLTNLHSLSMNFPYCSSYKLRGCVFSLESICFGIIIVLFHILSVSVSFNFLSHYVA